MSWHIESALKKLGDLLSALDALVESLPVDAEQRAPLKSLLQEARAEHAAQQSELYSRTSEETDVRF